MSVTVWGVATAPNQPAAHYNRWGQLTDAHSYRTFNPELPAGGINVDCDHDGVKVGTLVYAEIAPDERVRCVAVIDDGERLLELDQPLYWSATLDMRGCSGDHRLRRGRSPDHRPVADAHPRCRQRTAASHATRRPARPHHQVFDGGRRPGAPRRRCSNVPSTICPAASSSATPQRGSSTGESVRRSASGCTTRIPAASDTPAMLVASSA